MRRLGHLLDNIKLEVIKAKTQIHLSSSSIHIPDYQAISPPIYTEGKNNVFQATGLL